MQRSVSRVTGRFPEAGIYQTCNRYEKSKHKTSKTRTGDAGHQTV